MITIRELAKELGCSKTTVWSALRGDTRVAEKTRKIVMDLAKSRGYTPNAAFQDMCRQIRAGKRVQYRSTLGVVHHFDHEKPEETNMFHRAFVEGMREEAQHMGYELDFFWAKKPGLSGARLSDIMSARGIEGIIIPASNVVCELDLKWDKFAAVAVGFNLRNNHINRIEADYQQATNHCLLHLLELGYRNIGLVMRSDYEVWLQYNLTAPYFWYQSMMKNAERAPVLTIERDDKSSFLKWLKKHSFDAIITNNVRVINWCRQEGIRVPENLGITLSTPTPHPEFADITGVDYLPKGLGAAALNAVVSQIHRHEFGSPRTPKIVITRVNWRPGSTAVRVGDPVEGLLPNFPRSYVVNSLDFTKD